MGFLYVIGYRNLTKIGITQNLQRRMKELGPDVIYRVSMSPDYEELERKAHASWAEKRVPQSEWFLMEDVDRDQLFAWLEDQGILLSKVQVQKLVGEDFQDRVSDLDSDIRLAQQVTQAGQEGHSMGFEEGRAKGLKEGRSKGFADGLSKGRKEVRDFTVDNLTLFLFLCCLFFVHYLGYRSLMWVSHFFAE